MFDVLVIIGLHLALSQSVGLILQLSGGAENYFQSSRLYHSNVSNSRFVWELKFVWNDNQIWRDVVFRITQRYIS